MDKTAGGMQVVEVGRRVGAGLLVGASCFFLGRAQVYGMVSPFALAAVAPGFMGGKGFYFHAMTAMLGVASRFSVQHSVRYFVAMGLLWLINIYWQGRFKGAELLLKCAVIGIVMLFSGLFTAAVRGLTPFSLLITVLEGVLAFSLSFILIKGREALKRVVEARHEVLSQEELVCTAFLAAGIVMGAADIWIGWIALRYVLSGLLTLLMIKVGGGLPAGLLLGVLMHAAGLEGLGFALALAISALVCGFVKSDNRVVTASVFLCVLSAAALFFGDFRLELVVSIALASALYILLPLARIMSGAVEMMVPKAIGHEEYFNRVKDMTAGRLRGAADSFAKLSRTFGAMHKPRTGLTKAEVSGLLDDVIARSCIDCVKNYICWEEDFYDTYQKAYEALKSCDVLHVVNDGETPIMDFCIRRAEFFDNIRYFFELYRNDLKWHNYLGESRQMAAIQLSSAASIIGSLADGMSFEGRFDLELEKKLVQAFLKQGIKIRSAVVIQRKDGRVEAEIVHKSCGSRYKCAAYALIAAEALGRKMKKSDKDCTVEGFGESAICRLHLVEEHRFSVTCGAACLAAESGENGDSYAHTEHGNGRYTLILSDGMGKGKAAGAESRATVELFEDFMESGFDKDVATRLINSALLLKTSLGGKENFSTLDVCSIDLHTGRAEFLKVGASSTVIVSGDEAEVISSYSLPVGILESVEPESASRRVKDGDIIVMMTDGLLDTVFGPDTKESWIAAAVRDMKTQNPQKLADHLLSRAMTNAGGDIKDDMTVLVARIWEKR